MYNPQYSVGGELNGDPFIDQASVLVLVLLIAVGVAILYFRHSRRDGGHRR